MTRPLILIAVGKLKQRQRYVEAGIDDYSKRLSHAFAICWHELPEGDAKLAPQEQMAQEAERILKVLDSYRSKSPIIWALDEAGERPKDSRQFSQWLLETDHPNRGCVIGAQTPIIMVIGGHRGLAPTVRQQVHRSVSLSPLTFPHGLVRLVLLEQLYRAYKLSQNQPYHY